MGRPEFIPGETLYLSGRHSVLCTEINTAGQTVIVLPMWSADHFRYHVDSPGM